MIKLENIVKDYKVANTTVKALKGINLTFRDSEFVSILGPSGCGKTTLLNILGGLDKYTSGNLIIDNISTNDFKDRDWDTYRNHRVGFVFQSYNLIPHQTILENVELALNISGIKKAERIKKAKKALDRVGLADQYNKKPNQLSGGQCQRVAIARALVNDPDILLADEPTGALDTVTSVQIMELIKEIADSTLVIMVTHNPELAEKYSTRIIKLLDGEVQNDSNPYNFKKKSKKQVVKKIETHKKSKLGFWSAFRLSAKNLLSKFKRTLMVCFAGSIGIIGVASVLAVSTGVTSYINNMQNDMLSGNPITIQETALNVSAFLNETSSSMQKEIIKNSVEDGYVNVDKAINSIVEMTSKTDNMRVQNDITEEYVSFILNTPKEFYSALNIEYGIELENNIYTNSPFTNQHNKKISLTAIKEIYTSILYETNLKDYASLVTSLDKTFMQLPSSKEYILEQYDILTNNDSNYPTTANEIVIVVNKDTELSDLMLAQLGYYTQEEFINTIYKATNDARYDKNLDKDKFSYEDLLGRKFIWYSNDNIYKENFFPTEPNLHPSMPFKYQHFTNDTFTNGVELTITGILRPKEDLSYGSLKTGFYYTSEFSSQVLQNSLNSKIVKYLIDKDTESFTSGNFVTEHGSVDAGIVYDYSFEYEGTTHNKKGYIGKVNQATSMMNSMGMGIPEYKTISLRELGGKKLPNKISIYPVDFEIKDELTKYLNKWNSNENLTINGTQTPPENRSEIVFTDNLELVISMVGVMINMVTIALVAFTSLSLVVSTVMIAIITYVSVIERIKEIGVIRSLGGRKKDVSRLFIAESVLIGGSSGIVGIVITFLLTILINNLAGITVATLTLPIILSMIFISVFLTLISGLIPAKIASNKDPVVALRTE